MFLKQHYVEIGILCDLFMDCIAKIYKVSRPTSSPQPVQVQMSYVSGVNANVPLSSPSLVC